MPWIFATSDITRRTIHLSQKQWKPIQRHPGITLKSLERLQETLLTPQKVLMSEEDSSVHYYFRYYKDRKEYLFISVKYLNGEGFIITSFYTDTLQ